MIYDVRAISLEDAIDALFISHRSDEHRKIQFRVLAKQLLLDIISIIFVDIQDNQLFRMVCRNLPAQFAADGAAASGDEDDFTTDMIQHFFGIDPDRFSAQQVFDIHFFQIGYGDISVDELVSTGDGTQFTAGLFTDVQDLLSRLYTGRGNGKNDFINAVLPYGIQNAFPSAYDRYTAHQFAMAARLIVDDTFGTHA